MIVVLLDFMYYYQILYVLLSDAGDAIKQWAYFLQSSCGDSIHFITSDRKQPQAKLQLDFQAHSTDVCSR